MYALACACDAIKLSTLLFLEINIMTHFILIVIVIIIVPRCRRTIVEPDFGVILKLRSSVNQRCARYHSDLSANPMIEPAPLAAKLTGSKEIRHAALPVKKRSRGNLHLCRMGHVRMYKVYREYIKIINI